MQVPIGNCWEGPFFVYFVGTLSQYQCQNWGSLLAAPAPDRGHCTTLHGFSTSCRAEQQKQSLSLDMSYTYSLFILLGSSYILLDINISRWNIFSIDEIIFSLSLLHVAPGPAPGRRKLGRERSLSQRAAGGIIIISPSHRTTGSVVQSSASTTVCPSLFLTFVCSPRMYPCM